MRNIWTLALLIGLFFSTAVQSKEYKPFLCNYFVSSTLANDNCQGQNSWYKIYFDISYNSKNACLSGSDSLFNDDLIMTIFPDYLKSGDEIKSWVSGCDTAWIY